MRAIALSILFGGTLFFLTGCRLWEVVTPWRTGPPPSRTVPVAEPMESQPAPTPAPEPVAPIPPPDPVAREMPEPSPPASSPAAPSPEPGPAPAPAESGLPAEPTASMDDPVPEEAREVSSTVVTPPEQWPPPLDPRFKNDRPERVAMPVPVFPPDFDWEAMPGGWVEARVTIDPKGAVIAVEPVDASAPELVEPTIMALREARYKPEKAPNGVPIRVDFVERIEY